VFDVLLLLMFFTVVVGKGVVVIVFGKGVVKFV